jgi:uncharacterized membrane protein YbhN (UPF0104 family)
MKQTEAIHTKLRESFGQNSKTRSWFFFFLKILISGLAVVYVIRRVKLGEVTLLLSTAKTSDLIYAILAFVMSKAASASRTWLILNKYKVPISKWENIKLYWTGMAYNMFLPGGIGGDIYRTMIIKDRYNTGIKISAGTIITDRFAGAAVLILIALAFLPFTSLTGHWLLLSVAGLIITVIGTIIICRLIMPGLKGVIGSLFGWSFIIQTFQIVSVIFILKSLNIDNNYLNYAFLFLLTSLAAMLPVSVGGFGLREMVSLTVSPMLALDRNLAVAVSFTFFLITLLASAFGILTALELKRKNFETITQS